MSELRELVYATEGLSIRDQSELLGVARSTQYHKGRPETAENLTLMRRLDELHLVHPTFGSRRFAALLEAEGTVVNRKRCVRLLQTTGIEAIHSGGHTSQPGEGHRIYPHVHEGLEIKGPNQVWCSDITYNPLQPGFMYLVGVKDWWSLYGDS